MGASSGDSRFVGFLCLFPYNPLAEALSSMFGSGGVAKEDSQNSGTCPLRNGSPSVPGS
jgi:hypothetical protein